LFGYTTEIIEGKIYSKFAKTFIADVSVSAGGIVYARNTL